jgi:SAM-dependent methyltransferase
MALPGTHRKVVSFIGECIGPDGAGKRALDLGAGRGALCRRLRDAGFEVSACDQKPGLFEEPGIECRSVDDSGRLPYDDGSFDLVTAVEVVEHIDGHRGFFGEVARVLRPGGRLVFTTPNILSIKSRLLFLFRGEYYSFGPLEPGVVDPVSQHISPHTLDRYQWMLSACGLQLERVGTDKWQTRSMVFGFMYPLIRLGALLDGGRRRAARSPNSGTLLFGRKLFVSAVKP